MPQCVSKRCDYIFMISTFVLREAALKQCVIANKIFPQVTMSLLEAKKGNCVGLTWIYDPHRTNP